MKAISRDGGTRTMKEARLKSPLEEEPALQDPQHADGPALFLLFPAAAILYPRLFLFSVRMIFDRCCMRGPRLGAFCRVFASARATLTAMAMGTEGLRNS